ncbi:MAG: hypothetical protein ACLS48_06900 [[Eubacterium] siraeum]
MGSCSNLGDAQARRLKIRVKSKDKGNYFAHTLNNTVVAPPECLLRSLKITLRRRQRKDTRGSESIWAESTE